MRTTRSTTKQGNGRSLRGLEPRTSAGPSDIRKGKKEKDVIELSEGDEASFEYESSDEESEEEAEEKDAKDTEEKDTEDKETTEKDTKDTKDTKEKDTEEKDTILYIGRLPHGFYEQEMYSYFSQFGEVVQVRVSRNKKTGRSKHYGYIEFADGGVARVVAETMDNYLLSGHLLQVKKVEAARRELFWGGARVENGKLVGVKGRYAEANWHNGRVAAKAQAKHDGARSQEFWSEVEKRDEERKRKKEMRLAALGIAYSLGEVGEKRKAGKKR